MAEGGSGRLVAVATTGALPPNGLTNVQDAGQGCGNIRRCLPISSCKSDGFRLLMACPFRPT
jgi:hypothetical protein